MKNLNYFTESEKYLKENFTFKMLDDIAKAMTDNESADYLQQQRKFLFKHIHEGSKKRA